MENLLESSLGPGREMDPGLLAWLAQFDAEREKWLVEACNIERTVGIACRRMGLKGTLELFGSAVSGFGSSNSDVDLVFVMADGPGTVEPVEALKRVQAYLRDTEACYNLTTIFQPRSPLLKLTSLSGIEVDLMVNNFLGVHNTQLLRAYHDYGAEEGPTGRLRIDIMVRAVKEWARRCGLIGTIDGLLNSYAWTLMAVYYLQTIKVLPNFQLLAEAAGEPSRLIEGHETRFLVPEKHPSHDDYPASQATAGALVFGFFQFYAVTFDWADHAVCVRLGKEAPDYVRKVDLPFGHRVPWYIEDPFDTGMNLARGTTGPGRERILVALRAAAAQLLERPDWDAICPAGLDRPLTQLFLKLRLQDPVSREAVPSAVWSLLRPRQPLQIFVRANEGQPAVEVFAQFQTWQDMRSTQSSNEKRLSVCDQPVALYVSLGYTLWEELDQFVVISPTLERRPANDVLAELWRVFLPLPFGPSISGHTGTRLATNEGGPPSQPSGPPPKAAQPSEPAGRAPTPPMRTMNPLATAFVPSQGSHGHPDTVANGGHTLMAPPRPSAGSAACGRPGLAASNYKGGVLPVGAAPSGSGNPMPACGNGTVHPNGAGPLAPQNESFVGACGGTFGDAVRRHPVGAPPVSKLPGGWSYAAKQPCGGGKGAGQLSPEATAPTWLPEQPSPSPGPASASPLPVGEVVMNATTESTEVAGGPAPAAETVTEPVAAAASGGPQASSGGEPRPAQVASPPDQSQQPRPAKPAAAGQQATTLDQEPRPAGASGKPSETCQQPRPAETEAAGQQVPSAGQGEVAAAVVAAEPPAQAAANAGSKEEAARGYAPKTSGTARLAPQPAPKIASHLAPQPAPKVSPETQQSAQPGKAPTKAYSRQAPQPAPKIAQLSSAAGAKPVMAPKAYEPAPKVNQQPQRPAPAPDMAGKAQPAPKAPPQPRQPNSAGKAPAQAAAKQAPASAIPQPTTTPPSSNAAAANSASKAAPKQTPASVTHQPTTSPPAPKATSAAPSNKAPSSSTQQPTTTPSSAKVAAAGSANKAAASAASSALGKAAASAHGPKAGGPSSMRRAISLFGLPPPPNPEVLQSRGYPEVPHSMACSSSSTQHPERSLHMPPWPAPSVTRSTAGLPAVCRPPMNDASWERIEL